MGDFFIQNTIAERSEKIQDLTIENRENLGDQLVELVSRNFEAAMTGDITSYS